MAENEQTQTNELPVESDAQLAVKAEESKRLPSVNDLRMAIFTTRGSITQLAEKFELTPLDVENLIIKRELCADLDRARTLLEEDAVSILQQAMKSEDQKTALDAAKFVLQKLQSAKKHWNDSPQIAQQIVMSDSDKNLSIKNIFGIQTPAQQDIESL